MWVGIVQYVIIKMYTKNINLSTHYTLRKIYCFSNGIFFNTMRIYWLVCYFKNYYNCTWGKKSKSFEAVGQSSLYLK